MDFSKVDSLCHSKRFEGKEMSHDGAPGVVSCSEALPQLQLVFLPLAA